MKLDTIHITYSDVANNKTRIPTKIYIGLSIICFIALAVLITGVVLLLKEGQCKDKKEISSSELSSSKIENIDEYCELSNEAQRIGLTQFLTKCQKLYFKHFPTERIVELTNQDEINEVTKSYTQYNPTPKYLKEFTDEIEYLLKELDSLNVSEDLLKPREASILAKIEVFIKQYFATFSGSDYYSGEWMFGPNNFCLNRICSIGIDIQTLTSYFRPKTEEDLKFLYVLFNGFKKSFVQYTENMKEGVKRGMVKSYSSCIAGRDAFKQQYHNIITQDIFNGTTTSPFLANVFRYEFYSDLDVKVTKKWENDYNITPASYLYAALVKGFTQPLLDFYEYLSKEHIRHCPPDDVASGLSSLPLDYVYLDGKMILDKPTNKTLPYSSKKLNGRSHYKKVLSRFVTTDLTPEEIYDEGQKQINILYPKIVNLSKEITNESDDLVAIEKIKAIMNGDDQWHGASSFPEEESNERAHRLCVNDESAQKYCPTRWKSIQKWGKYIQRVLAMIDPQLTYVFYFTGDKRSVPNCPIAIERDYNPSNGAVYFKPSDENCTFPTYFGLPFFLERYGPRYQDWSVIGHEGRPGHHFQYQGTVELFKDPCSGNIESYFNAKGHFTGFIEGWAFYAENPVLSDDIMLYEDNPMQKLGMYKWLMFRALRLIVDSGLHYRKKTRTWALEQFEKYIWDTSDFVQKEVTRYMSTPGQATSYMLGRLSLMKVRSKVVEQLRFLFNHKDFHYQILSLGQVPLNYLTKHMDRYLSCLRNAKQQYCQYYLTPVRDIPAGNIERGTYKSHASPFHRRISYV